ncbi:N-glycosidase YbiA-like [Antedon mediterranea]|uniref:N-glycosidase YbiA-like n=1 Tax=Antedon mediterranea TaxID=105859 RepID=UPI003AF8E053
MPKRKSTDKTTMASPVKMKADEQIKKITLFYTSESPFSNFYPAGFQVDGVKYSCSEQYMMYQKAVLFRDDKIASEILAAGKPGRMKQLGRKVQNFDQDLWNKNKREIVKKGVKAKFSQNADLKEQLLKTRGTTLGEASARDHVWGIGLGLKNPLALDKKNWKGQNLLGYILTEIREELIAEGS